MRSALEPAPDQARSWLRRELLAPEYHERGLLERVLGWIERRISQGLGLAADAPPLSTAAAMLVLVALVVGMGLLLSRARRTARATVARPVLSMHETVSAAEMRRRARSALEEGRHEDAVVDGFRALALRQVEDGHLDDAPGATAHEVADVLADGHPGLRERVHATAGLFDAVLYGGRAATRAQAVEVLALDDDLVGVR